MATKTLGTNATTTLTALAFSQANLDADIASIEALIKDDINPLNVALGGSYSRNGLLFVPNRGVLKILPGDWVGVDGAGWPILVSGNIIGTSWTHT